MQKKRLLLSFSWIFLLCLVQVALLRTLFVEHNLPTKTKACLRVAYYPSQLVFSSLSPYGKGFEAEIVESFCLKYGLRPSWRKVNCFTEAFELLRSGQVDIFVTGGHIPSAKLAREAAAPLTVHQKILSFLKITPLYPCVAGPAYHEDKILLVHNEKYLPLRQESDLCDSSILLPPSAIWEDWLGNNFTVFKRCNPDLVAYAKSGEQTFLNMLNTEQARFGLIARRLFACWQPFYPKILPTTELKNGFALRCFWNTSDARRSERLRLFFQTLPKMKAFEELKEKYFGFFPEQTDRYQLFHLQKTLQDKLPNYRELILAAGKKYRIDPLLLSALIYQESHFKKSAVSRTGVGGLLQLSLDTIQRLGLTNRFQPEQAINGGAKYLRLLWDSLEDMNLTAWDRLYLTLASYNQGAGHVRDACRLAARQGLSPRKWQNVKKVFPLLSRSRYYQQSRHGYCRGYEAVTFVENIRYYYYILYGLAFLGLPESKDLALLLQGRPGDWP